MQCVSQGYADKKGPTYTNPGRRQDQSGRKERFHRRTMPRRRLLLALVKLPSINSPSAAFSRARKSAIGSSDIVNRLCVCYGSYNSCELEVRVVGDDERR